MSSVERMRTTWRQIQASRGVARFRVQMIDEDGEVLSEDWAQNFIRANPDDENVHEALQKLSQGRRGDSVGVGFYMLKRVS